MSASQALVYSENSSFQNEDGLQLMSLVVIEEGMKVLDIGCGPGDLTSVLADKVGPTGQVIGIDPDKERIALAKSTHGSIKNLTFQEGSAEAIPGYNYDIVFSNYVFHWIEDKKRAFQNAFHCLKPSGSFAVCFEIKLSPFVVRYINLMEPSRVTAVENKLFFRKADEIEEIALLSGFTVQHKEESNRVVRFNSFDGFVQSTYGGFGGLVDPQYMDSERLQELQEACGRQQIELELCTVVSYVFIKDN